MSINAAHLAMCKAYRAVAKRAFSAGLGQRSLMFLAEMPCTVKELIFKAQLENAPCESLNQLKKNGWCYSEKLGKGKAETWQRTEKADALFAPLKPAKPKGAEMVGARSERFVNRDADL